MTHLNDIDERLLAAMQPSDRVSLLLRDAGFASLRQFADHIGRSRQEVSFCARGDRVYDDIRDQIAEAAGISRVDLDLIIDGEPTQAAS